MMLLLQLVWPLEALGWITNLAQRALASAGRSFAWLDGIEPLPEPAQPAPPAGGPLGIRFEQVGFAYGGEVDVLHDLDLVIEPGEIVAVCGPTGSGKTSLLNLLPRFYDPTGGRVLVGGVDTRDVPIAELRADVALVTQRPVLFSVPLRENLPAGREDADWDEVLAACAAAGVDSFGPTLPEGYDTLIGERGVNLSGGQRQRVALARALVDERACRHPRRSALRGRHFHRAAPRRAAPSRARRPDRARRDAASLDGRARRPRGRPHRRARSSSRGSRRDLLRAGGPFAALFGDEVVAA